MVPNAVVSHADGPLRAANETRMELVDATDPAARSEWRDVMPPGLGTVWRCLECHGRVCAEHYCGRFPKKHTERDPRWHPPRGQNFVVQDTFHQWVDYGKLGVKRPVEPALGEESFSQSSHCSRVDAVSSGPHRRHLLHLSLLHAPR